ncbi:hypothetical protein EON76_01910 [bacterium]|nr:MAG: hypothetical protein EON76_01910 [bacterium]
MPIVNADPNHGRQPSLDPVEVLGKIIALESPLVYRTDEDSPVAKALGYDDDVEQLLKEAINKLSSRGLVSKSAIQLGEKFKATRSKSVKVRRYTVTVDDAQRVALNAYLLSS